MALLEITNLKKVYGSRKEVAKTEALKNINFTVNQGEFVAIMGESGSGKSTLLNIIATLDRPTNGKIILDNTDFSLVKDKEVSTFRRKKLGFVFQDFNLLDQFNIKDNILLPLVLSGEPLEMMEKQLINISEILSISDILNKFPYEISGGQKQRVAIARAVITNPTILLADEPTGSLDSKSAELTMKLFEKLNKKGQTILMVTHSMQAASFATRVLFIQDGIVYHEIYRGDRSTENFRERISESLSMVIKRGIQNEK